jgi:hypothetical protein
VQSSNRAAFSNPKGISRKNCRKRKMPKAWIYPQSDLYPCRPRHSESLTHFPVSEEIRRAPGSSPGGFPSMEVWLARTLAFQSS